VGTDIFVFSLKLPENKRFSSKKKKISKNKSKENVDEL
jgi:hypothetical protein